MKIYILPLQNSSCHVNCDLAGKSGCTCWLWPTFCWVTGHWSSTDQGMLGSWRGEAWLCSFWCVENTITKISQDWLQRAGRQPQFIGILTYVNCGASLLTPSCKNSVKMHKQQIFILCVWITLRESIYNNNFYLNYGSFKFSLFWMVFNCPCATYHVLDDSELHMSFSSS